MKKKQSPKRPLALCDQEIKEVIKISFLRVDLEASGLVDRKIKVAKLATAEKAKKTESQLPSCPL